MKKITVVGSSNVDTTLHVVDFPKPGQTIEASKITQAGGGKGANQAIAAQKAGSEVNFINRVGDDSFGTFILKQLASYGVSPTFVQTSMAQITGHAYILLNQAGQNSIVIDHGANYDLSVEDIDAASQAIAESDCVIAQLETPIEATIEAFKIARQNGILTVLNPAPARADLPAELLELTDVITPNETESTVLTGLALASDADLAVNAEKLHALGIKHVVITYGSKGAYISSGKTQQLVPAFKVDAVDTTGAGDTFIGFLCAKLNPDLSNLPEAALFANKASSLEVQRLGAQPAIPSLKEVEDSLRGED